MQKIRAFNKLFIVMNYFLIKLSVNNITNKIEFAFHGFALVSLIIDVRRGYQ
jgi:hypothetical protein